MLEGVAKRVLVFVGIGGVDVSVAELQNLAGERRRALVVLQFPRAEANGGHQDAIVQFADEKAHFTALKWGPEIGGTELK